MTDESGTHFAHDEDLLSRYALGTLEAAERENVDRHAAGCSTCMASLRREMLIAAGARRLGRENLKGELKRRITAGPERARWPRVLSAAAAVGIVAGLGVYYAWFSGGKNLPSQPGGTVPLASRTESFNQDEKNAPERQRADEVMKEKTAESPAPAGAQITAKQKASAPSVYRRADNERRTVPPTGRIASSGTASGAGTMERGGEFWSDGIVEHAGDALDAASAPRAAVAQEKKMLLYKSKADKEETDRLKDADSRVQGEYLIRQQPASTLPGDQERSGRNQYRVPTRVDQRGSTTTLTMYLDSLVDEKDLRSAIVESARDDSVVVTLGGKKILYRFPPGQTAQQKRQK